MGTTFTLSQEQYEALVAYAQRGASSPSDAVALDAFLQDIEASNGITRHTLWIQWQEQDQPLPPSASFPSSWPPSLRYRLELLTRPIARADVLQVLATRARKPVNVLVTPDPGATLGWTRLEDFFHQ